MAAFEALIPGLPEDLARECLTRIHASTFRSASGVSRSWQRLLGRSEYFHIRKQNGLTCKVACLVQALYESLSVPVPKPNDPPAFGITLFYLEDRTWERVDSLPAYPNGLPLYSQVASSEWNLVNMGGWDPVSYNPTSHVFIYNWISRKWKKGQDMPAKRSLFAIGAIDGRVLIAGGHDPDKNASDFAWIYYAAEDKWTELPRMSEERDECHGMVIGSEFWVISGYSTQTQGEFNSSADVYNIDTGKWRRVDQIWARGQSPRSCVRLGQNSEMINWGKPSSMTQPGKCPIDLGEDIIVYDGGIPGLLLLNKGKHAKVDNSNINSIGDGFEKLDVPKEFSGFVQSGCLMEL